VPQDLSVVGFDDIPMAALVTPALTTCHVPRHELGEQAMQLLLDRIDGCTEECKEIVLQTELIVRASAPQAPCSAGLPGWAQAWNLAPEQEEQKGGREETQAVDLFYKK
jgi:LacI family transcriptional regulator